MKFKEIELPFKVKRPVLALGGQTKNTLCFAEGKSAILSPLHPDLNHPEDFFAFEKDVKRFLKKRPKIIACDLHPEYQSTKYCQSLELRAYSLQLIQHHHSHIASCMAENGLKNQKIIGVAFDGTGLGSDNSLWGAEFLICDYKDFKRAAHLKEVPLLGARQAVLEPWRLSAAWLYSLYKDRFLALKVDFTRGLDKNKWRVLKGMYLSKFNAPLASSMGRLFDAAASLVLAKYRVNFEAQLAIELEKLAARCAPCAMRYNFKIIRDKDGYVIDPAPMFREIITDLKRREPKEKIAYRFHLTAAEMIRRVCLILRKGSGIGKVALSGGVFQNNLLLRLSLDLLYKEHFTVFRHKKLSCGDSSISLGEIAAANFQSRG